MNTSEEIHEEENKSDNSVLIQQPSKTNPLLTNLLRAFLGASVIIVGFFAFGALLTYRIISNFHSECASSLKILYYPYLISFITSGAFTLINPFSALSWNNAILKWSSIFTFVASIGLKFYFVIYVITKINRHYGLCYFNNG